MSGAAPVFYDQTSDGVSIGVTSFIITVLAVVIATFAFLLSRKRTTNRPEQQQQQQVAEASKQEPKQLPTVSVFVESLDSLTDLLDGLSSLCQCSDLIIMFKADTDEAEESFKKQLLSKLPVVPAHKILCCERDKSRVAMARHIQPLLHIDSNVDVWMDLKGKIPNSVLLKNDSTSLEHEDESRSLTECASLVKCFTTA